MSSIKRKELENFLNKTLNIWDFQDYGPNGLQIEGIPEIKKIVFAVSATRKSIEFAVEQKADALVVHHGLFWKFHGPKTITKEFARRVRPIIKSEINLFGYHLPLDAHIEYGNAAAIAKKLGLKNISPFGDYKGSPTGVKGSFNKAKTPNELENELHEILNHKVIVATEDQNNKIKSMGIITGGANGDWIFAKREGLDSYLTGEISEHDWHEAQEAGITFFAGGHNATEQFGVQSLQKLIEEKFSIETIFYPSENPA